MIKPRNQTAPVAIPDSVSKADLRAARGLAVSGNGAQARQAYLQLLRASPDCLAALVELGALAEADGYGQAAWSAYSRAAGIDPQHPVALTGLGNLLLERENYPDAKSRYLAALAAAPDFAPAHQGLARCLTALGEPGAHTHWQAGYAGYAVSPSRGSGRVPLLVLAAARGGNVPCKSWIDPGMFSITTVYADFFDETKKLPPHALIFNAIGDAELCDVALLRAGRMIAGGIASVINPPDRVRQTSRAENAERLRAIPGVVTPQTRLLARAELLAHGLRFPILLRSTGFHTGRNFVRVADASELTVAAATLPGDNLLAIEFLDVRGVDGMARKYRVMFIGGRIYPLHLAASTDWKVHYFSSAMEAYAHLRAEEQLFLEDMESVLGARAMAALAGIQNVLGLDYAGVDFALAPDGSLILFEANATMIIHGPDERPVWDYRRRAIDAARTAAKNLLKAMLPDECHSTLDR